MGAVYSPRVEIRLIKTARRSSLAQGLQAASRFRDLDSIDLTPYLVTGEPVTVQQSVSGVGTWSCQLADRIARAGPAPGQNEALEGLNESLSSLIEPMDMVEIRMAHSPHKYKTLPVVMRGFVSNVARSRSMAGGTPQRRISLAGHDYSKVLDILRIYYLNDAAVGDNIVSEMKFFQKYAGIDTAKIMSAKDFAALVLTQVVNKFIARLTVDASGARVGAAVMRELLPEVTIAGTVSPLTVSLFNDGSVRQFLSQFLDVGAFNEMFVDDREQASVLVIRPNPFLDMGRTPIQKSADGLAPSYAITEIADADVEQISEGRSDAGVANYFWVTNGAWSVQESVEVRQLAASKDATQYALFNYVNTNAARYGFRKMEVSSSLGPPGMNYGDAQSEAQLASSTTSLIGWLTERRRVLAEQNRDNSILEDGHMVLRGDETIRRGTYLQLGEEYNSPLYYAVSVTQTIIPNGAFRTMVEFERGTGFAVRAGRESGSYLSELNLTGTKGPK